jgi:hypothetical protein
LPVLLFVACVVFTMTFMAWSRGSFMRGVWMITAVHALNNLVAFLLGAAAG